MQPSDTPKLVMPGLPPPRTGSGLNRVPATLLPDGSWALPVVQAPDGLYPTDIEWADFGFNPLRTVLTREVRVKHGAVVDETEPDATLDPAVRLGWGCVKKSAGCDSCYSEAVNVRFGTGLGYVADYLQQGLVRLELDEQRLEAALGHKTEQGWRSKSWDGRPKVFVAYMTDLFSEFVPFTTIDRVFELFERRDDIDWMVLTKRPDRMAEYLGGRRRLDNLYAGASVETQDWADHRIPHLSRCPAGVRFLSCEPLLELAHSIDLTGFEWVILGGGSEAGARACDPDWLRLVTQRCADEGVACFARQLRFWPWPADLAGCEWPRQ